MRSWSRTARATPPKDMPAGFPMPAGLPPGMTTQQVATARVLRARHASSRRLSEVGAVAEAGAGSLLPSQASSLAEASDGSRRRASRVRFAEEEPSTSSRKGSSASIPALEPDTPTAPRYNAASFLELVTTTQVGLPPKATQGDTLPLLTAITASAVVRRARPSKLVNSEPTLGAGPGLHARPRGQDIDSAKR